MTTNAGRLALIASQGTRATGAPALLLATAAANVGWEVAIFFTFHGVALLARDLPPPPGAADAAADKTSEEGSGKPEPAAEQDTRKRASDQAYGPFGGIGWPIPEFLAGLPPAFAAMASEHMDPPPAANVMPDIEALRETAAEAGVKLFACQQSATVLGLTDDALIEQVTPGGAMAFLEFSKDADVSFAF